MSFCHHYKGNGQTGTREEKHLDTLIWREKRFGIYLFSWPQNLAQGSLGSTENFLFIPVGSESSSKDEFNHI